MLVGSGGRACCHLLNSVLARVRCWQATAATAEDGPSRVAPSWRAGPLPPRPVLTAVVHAARRGPTRTIFLYEIGPHHHRLGGSSCRPCLHPTPHYSHPPTLSPPRTLGVALRPPVPAGTPHGSLASSTEPLAAARYRATAPPPRLAPHAQPARAHQGHTRRVTRAGSGGGRGASAGWSPQPPPPRAAAVV